MISHLQAFYLLEYRFNFLLLLNKYFKILYLILICYFAKIPWILMKKDLHFVGSYAIINLLTFALVSLYGIVIL